MDYVENEDGVTEWPPKAKGPMLKEPKGAGLIRRRETKKARVLAEDKEKDKVRARDRQCRWPHCENCRAYKPRLEVAHLTAKGMGGDPNGDVTTADQMILLDFLTHQSGPLSLEQHGRRIVPLTDKGTYGPCEFWQTDLETGGEFLVARERSPFVYERD
jgi:hypothetical protein